VICRRDCTEAAVADPRAMRRGLRAPLMR